MAEKQKLTKRVIDSLFYPDQGQKLYQDSELRGFAIRVTPSKKTFIINRKFKNKLIRHKFGEYPAMTVEQARSVASDLLNQLSQGINLKEDSNRTELKNITLLKTFEDHLNTKPLRPKTERGYRDIMKLHLSQWKNMPLTEINRTMVLDRHKELSQHSKSSANSTMRLLRTLFNFAQAKYRISDTEPLIVENPVKILSELKVWNKEKRRSRLISTQELPTWYQTLTSLKSTDSNNYAVTKDYLLFILFTGLRRNEAAPLQWDQINFKRKTFTIPDTKNHKEHTLPLSEYLFKLLNRLKKQRLNEFPYVFPDISNISYIKEPKSFIKKVSEASEIQFSTHDLRRTFITIAESLDIPYYALKRLLNHSQANDVTAGYIIDDVERLRQPMIKISEKIQNLLTP